MLGSGGRGGEVPQSQDAGTSKETNTVITCNSF